ncbi:tRNA (adenosine(37)-N6)-threonylcarbamoyltransferase complex ATPase subunit type 1 TsaE [Tropicimonas sp. IMCC6043]|uniref:tRNA (adenosine(37)-N6)-threonylcarbamoyltransferase complex ATPase subunit type 1 TsaE n=1 Tax=Tropicimonas sp. IMCC6043 TaxID=2510645 RepID=UPI00101CC957|nr:tRNA (adenosine(37)-N6)-threonylcarbamoyltransferase complex ATPase subunit type 1 TsaE [Tropicimonas sp. IMCC6043]RYH10894.1 tRNA (adenosine(37)-N6)-threonylcarbamoyltransferase complex ATPase subunit type 1 TsaE [Tropicimonas sp. IMCC6043]
MATPHSSNQIRLSLDLPRAADTAALGRALAHLLRKGETLLLAGPIGAGKSHLARATIREVMARHGAAAEDIPSPTYTLVQTYAAGTAEIWHADLYRLTDPQDVFELGLDEAFTEAICLVEWPDRLGETAPESALLIELSLAGDGRRADLSGVKTLWAERLSHLAGLPETLDDPAG